MNDTTTTEYVPKVGDKVFVKGNNRNPDYDAVVVKVGRKWVYITRESRVGGGLLRTST